MVVCFALSVIKFEVTQIMTKIGIHAKRIENSV
jgi:hypothetical protein